LINLVTNARDALPFGGEITVETLNVTLHNREFHTTMPIPAGRYVLLRVKDTGTGMDQRTKACVFDPFFTTKNVSEVGRGCGLGLATVYGIVRQSEGYIWVDSEFGKGSCFNIYFPAIDQEPTNPEQPETEPARLQRRTLTALVVEDSETLRNAMPRVLEQAKLNVLLASDGIEALELAERYRKPIHLLITDVMMPGLPGTEVARQLRETRPQMKILYMSGYSSEILGEHSRPAIGYEFIQKPFKPRDLLKKIQALLVSEEFMAAGTVVYDDSERCSAPR